ncbi:MAG: C-type lectin domain-containing protein, partial [Myxococcota bacterium]|nr:C-type lectin domain-containing protein [Myxococcota bacterium]
MNGNAAAVVVAACAAAVGAAIAGVVACIPDLPSEPLATGFCGDGIIDVDAETCDPGPGAGDAAIAGCNARCQMECPSGAAPWPVNNHCYQRAALAARTFQQATASCQGGSHIATFASEAEFQQALPLVVARPFWVGLDTAPDRYNSVVLFEPGWSPNCPGCYAHTPAPEASLPVSDASAEGSPEDCITAVSDPQQAWAQYPCTGSGYRVLDVICELEPVGRRSVPCEAGICID